MNREEAIKVLEKQFDKSCGNYRYQNAEKLDFEDALWVAISALRQQEHFREVTKKVEPLTLDELREVAETGDPVWLVGAYRTDSWVVIEKVGDRKYLPWVDYAEFGSDEPYDFAISDYGDSFKAYRQKPEEVQK